MDDKEQIAYNQFLQLRNDDPKFAEQYPNTGEAFDSWYKYIYLNEKDKKEVERIMEKEYGSKVGDRVISITSIDRFPHFLLEEGIKGTVELMNKYSDLMVRVDEHIPELDEWDNCLCYVNDGLVDGFMVAYKQEFRKILPTTLNDQK